jgi:hypothetical protein
LADRQTHCDSQPGMRPRSHRTVPTSTTQASALPRGGAEGDVATWQRRWPLPWGRGGRWKCMAPSSAPSPGGNKETHRVSPAPAGRPRHDHRNPHNAGLRPAQGRGGRSPGGFGPRRSCGSHPAGPGRWPRPERARRAERSPAVCSTSCAVGTFQHPLEPGRAGPGWPKHTVRTHEQRGAAGLRCWPRVSWQVSRS